MKNNEKNGKGKEYYHNGKLKYEGEYIKGKKWNGKGYDKLFNLVYELKNGNGIIKEYRNDGLIEFEGEYLNGERNGKGKEYIYEKNVFSMRISSTIICNYIKGKKNGKGKEYYYENYEHLKFEGEYINNERNREGKEYNLDGNLLFDGEYKNGKKWKGKYKIHRLTLNEIEFEGEYKDGILWSGKGYNLINGNIEYEIIDGKTKGYNYYDYIEIDKNGKGEEYKNGNLIFEGEYLNGERNGKGKEYNLDGNLLFDGEYKNGKIWNGKGYNGGDKLVFEIKEGNGLIKKYDYYNILFEGEYINGESNGHGKVFINVNEVLFEGEFLNGKINGKRKIFYF